MPLGSFHARQIFAFALVIASPLVFPRAHAHADPPRVDFVIDLDSVMIDRIKDSMGVVPPSRIIEAPGGPYRLADGAEEFIESLRRTPGAKITFFSHASNERNLVVLGKVKLPGGGTALEAAEGRVLDASSVIDTSRMNLTWEESRLYQPDGQAFSGSYKKDISKVPGLNLENAILVDDQSGYALRGQEKNMLWLRDTAMMQGKDESALAELEMYLKDGDAEGLKDLVEAHLGNKNRLAFAKGMIDEALEVAAREKIPLRDALWKLQWRMDGASPRLLPTRESVEYYRKGALAFKKVNPGYHFSPLLPPGPDGRCDAGVLRAIQALRAGAAK